MLLTLLLFSATFLLPLTLTMPPPLADIPVSCLTSPTSRFDIADCETFISNIRRDKTFFDWARQSLEWGPTQPRPSKTPVSLTYRSCRIKIQARNPSSGAVDKFMFSDYFDALEEVLRTCFTVKAGKTGGATPLGGKNIFYAYIGGIPRHEPDTLSATPISNVSTS